MPWTWQPLPFYVPGQQPEEWRTAQYAGRFAWELAGARGGGSLVVFVPAGGEQRGAQLPALIDGPLSLMFPPFP